MPTYALRYDVGDEQRVQIRCGQLVATQYGQLGVVFERQRNGLFELYSTDRAIMRKVWYATRRAGEGLGGRG